MFEVFGLCKFVPTSEAATSPGDFKPGIDALPCERTSNLFRLLFICQDSHNYRYSRMTVTPAKYVTDGYYRYTDIVCAPSRACHIN